MGRGGGFCVAGATCVAAGYESGLFRFPQATAHHSLRTCRHYRCGGICGTRVPKRSVTSSSIPFQVLLFRLCLSYLSAYVRDAPNLAYWSNLPASNPCLSTNPFGHGGGMPGIVFHFGPFANAIANLCMKEKTNQQFDKSTVRQLSQIVS